MKKLIYGSTAAKFWFSEFREPKDFEIISKDKDWVEAFQYILDNNINDIYVDKNFLFTIKVSHAAWDIHWDKTMHDIVFFKNKGSILDYELYKLLYNDWKIIHKDKKVKLDVTNEEFFTSKIERKFNHDYLHEVLCFYDRPLHERIRKDLNSPMCSEELFNQLSFDDKIKCAMEETFVIATERFVIPKKVPLNHAKYKALKQLIISMTSGWFNLFLILNFDILIKYEIDTWKKNLKMLNL